MVTGQKRLRTKFGREPPKKSSVYSRYNLSDKCGFICKAKWWVETSLNEDKVKEFDSSSGERAREAVW